jgi:hypothetical protein
MTYILKGFCGPISQASPGVADAEVSFKGDLEARGRVLGRERGEEKRVFSFPEFSSGVFPSVILWRRRRGVWLADLTNGSNANL